MRERIKEILDAAALEISKNISEHVLSSIYRVVLYSLVYSKIELESYSSEELSNLKSLLKGVAPIFSLTLKTRLAKIFRKLHVSMNRIFSDSIRPVTVDDTANLEKFIDEVVSAVRQADAVLVFDCMSVAEFLVAAGYFRRKGHMSMFLNTLFINPIGLTRFMTHQIRDGRQILREVGRKLAQKLGASVAFKESYIDKVVHNIGEAGLEIFAENLDVKKIIDEINNYVKSSNRVIVLADHGYDILWSTRESYFFIDHGYTRSGEGYRLVVNFSRFSPILYVGRHRW